MVFWGPTIACDYQYFLLPHFIVYRMACGILIPGTRDQTLAPFSGSSES